MQILPVIDLLQGRVVRGVAGRRAEYKPIVSQLTRSTDPLEVALAFRSRFGFNELYLADLDAIAGHAPALDVCGALHRAEFRLWVDAGLRTPAQAQALARAGVATIIAGLETMPGPAALALLLKHVAPQQLVFSLDLNAGMPLSTHGDWRCSDAFAIAAEAVALGVQRILVLDLAQVGVGAGVGTETLCRRLRAEFPRLEIAAGGGVRDLDDVAALAAAGADWLLIASALHDGRLTRHSLERRFGSKFQAGQEPGARSNSAPT